MEVLACLNGEMMPVEQARVPVWDRGFLFGDSVYEVFRMYRGRCWLEPEHFARLRLEPQGARVYHALRHRRAGRPHAPHDRSQRDSGRDRVYPDPRGASHRGPTLSRIAGDPHRTHRRPRPYDDGPTARLRETGVKVISHPDLRWKRCDIKTTNLLGNCIATEAARRAGCFEAILVDSAGFVTEATHTSLIWVRQGRLEGTPGRAEILRALTRQLVIRNCSGRWRSRSSAPA